MSAPATIVHVTPDDRYAAAAELEHTGRVEWTDQGGETIVLALPVTNLEH